MSLILPRDQEPSYPVLAEAVLELELGLGVRPNPICTTYSLQNLRTQPNLPGACPHLGEPR